MNFILNKLTFIKSIFLKELKINIKIFFFTFIYLFRSSFKKVHLELNNKEKVLFHNLKKNGFLEYTKYEEHFLERIHEKYFNQEGNLGDNNSSKSFWNNKSLNREKTIDLSKLIFKNDKTLYKIVSNYFSEPYYLESIELVRSLNLGSKYQSSQLFHRDFNSIKTLKVFIYFSDVNSSDDGPFSIITQSLKARMLSFINPIHKSLKWEKRVSKFSNVKKFLGKRGKVFIVDTFRNFHFGSRITNDGSRLMLIVSFRNINRLHGTDPFQPIELKNIASN